MVKEVYNPKAVIPHAASLHQACAHCAIFPTAASRRSLGRISVPVWPDTLSGRLPVVALVGHHPTNKLIGRGPIPHRKSFPPQPMQAVVLSGIRPSFPSLSRSAGQITHVLLTRSPLEYPRKGLSVRLACVKHAASVRPEPGSNSPNKNPHQNGRIQSEQSEPNKKTPKTGIKKQNHTLHTGSIRHGKKTTTKTKPPNTLLSSQTTPHRPRNKTRGSWPLTRCADDERTPPKWNFPLGHRRARRADRVAATRLSYATGNLESNKLLDGVFRAAPRSAHAFDPGDISLAAA